MEPLGGGGIRAFLSQLGLGGASQPLPALGSGYDADGNPIASDPSPYMAQLGTAPTVQSTGGPVQAVTPAGQALAAGVADTLMAPGRAYNGQMAVRDPETGHMTQEATDWGAGTALGMLGGSSIPRRPVAAPGEVALGMFAGRTAKTADLGALSQAEKLAGSGAPREQIWNETGWFQGPDQQWRFEIPDNRSFLKGTGTAGDVIEKRGDTLGRAPGETTASDIAHHPMLYDAYPSNIADARMSASAGGGGIRGQYAAPDFMANLHEAPTVTLSSKLNGDDARSVLLHELQHGIQDTEGFAVGGDPAALGDRMPDPQAVNDARVMSTLITRGTPRSEAASKFAEMVGRDPHPDASNIMFTRTPDEIAAMPSDPMEAYRRLAGEVEARNVQARRDMTPEQRQATPPWATQDVPDAQQIVRFGR